MNNIPGISDMSNDECVDVLKGLVNSSSDPELALDVLMYCIYKVTQGERAEEVKPYYPDWRKEIKNSPNASTAFCTQKGA